MTTQADKKRKAGCSRVRLSEQARKVRKEAIPDWAEGLL